MRAQQSSRPAGGRGRAPRVYEVAVRGPVPADLVARVSAAHAAAIRAAAPGRHSAPGAARDLYQIVSRGELKTIKVGASRRVPVRALEECVDRLLHEQHKEMR